MQDTVSLPTGVDMRIGLFIAEAGVDGSDVTTVVEQARWAEAHGFTTGWVPHIPWSLDGLTSLALAGQVTERIELGSAVMPTWSRHPYAMAQQALTTQAAVGGRLLLGLGPSHPEWVANAYGMSYDRPLHHVREYLSVLESAFSGQGQVDFIGETYRSTSVLDVPGAADVPIFLAALGPGMLRLAGERTSGTITWMGDERAHAEHVVPSNHRSRGVGRSPCASRRRGSARSGVRRCRRWTRGGRGPVCDLRRDPDVRTNARSG